MRTQLLPAFRHAALPRTSHSTSVQPEPVGQRGSDHMTGQGGLAATLSRPRAPPPSATIVSYPVRITFQVDAPTIPSTRSPWLNWTFLTAASVFGPKSRSTVTDL